MRKESAPKCLQPYEQLALTLFLVRVVHEAALLLHEAPDSSSILPTVVFRVAPPKLGRRSRKTNEDNKWDERINWLIVWQIFRIDQENLVKCLWASLTSLHAAGELPFLEVSLLLRGGGNGYPPQRRILPVFFNHYPSHSPDSVNKYV